MKAKLFMTLAALCLARTGVGEDVELVPGTNVAMDIHEVYEWNSSTNTHRSPSGSGMMVIIYSRLPISDAIAKFKPQILSAFPLPLPSRACMIDKDWFEGDDKYYLVCHAKVSEKWEERTYVLFIAKADETYIFVGHLYPEADPNASAKIMAAYQSSKISTKRSDPRRVLPYDVKPPDNYVLEQLAVSNSTYRIERKGNQEPDHVSITSYIGEKDKRLGAYLPRFVSPKSVKILESAVNSSAGDQKYWKLVFFDPEKKQYHVQHVVRKAKYVLGFYAVVGEKSYKTNRGEIDRLVAKVTIRNIKSSAQSKLVRE